MPKTKHTEAYNKENPIETYKKNVKTSSKSKEIENVSLQDLKNLPDEISQDELFDVLEFAKAYNGYYNNNLFNTDLVNARMKEIGENPRSMSETELAKALEDPKYSEEPLRNLGQYFENTNMSYKRMLDRYGKMLSFDYTTTCTNVKNASEYKSEAYKKDKQKLTNFFDKFNVKSEFKKICQKLIREDASYVALRAEGQKYGLQFLPTKHCKISNSWENGYLFDFNMIWFISNPGVDIDCYPPAFKEKLEDMWDGEQKKYIPSSNARTRNGSYVYWTQMSPDDNVWMWKFDDTQAAQVPHFMPLFKDLLTNDQVRSLQKNKYIIAASRILVGLIPMIKEQTAGNIRDKIALDPKTIGRFMNLFRKGIDPSITTVAAPFEDVKEFDFASPNSDQNIQADHGQKVITGSGSIPDIVYPNNNMSGIAFNYAVAVEEYMMTYVYPMFANFLEYYINKRTRKYKFKVLFEGIETPHNAEVRQKVVKDLAAIGIVLPQKIAASIGMQPQDFIRQLEEGITEEFIELLTPIQSIFNGQAEEAGRPQSTDRNISESGATTRDAGSNVGRGGKV